MILRLAFVFLLLAATWTALHPTGRWEFIDGPVSVPDDELLCVNPV